MKKPYMQRSVITPRSSRPKGTYQQQILNFDDDMKQLRLCLLIFAFLPIMTAAQTNTFPSSGNVGIGTLNPTRALEVRGGIASDTYVIISNPANAEANVHLSWFNNIPRIRVGGNGIGNNNGFDIQGTGNKSLLRITDNGEIGIGTTDPQGKLDIRGALVLDAAGDAGLYTGTAEVEQNRYLRLLNSPTVRTASGLKAGGILIADSYAYANPLKNDLIVKGNVGIGTASPQEKLSVNGHIRAKAIKVEVTNWPDYVFEDEYSFRTIDELKEYIETNQHLPGIPSASDVQKDGVNLGEMNAKLLEKIEELTLYLLQQSEMLKKQQQLINAQQKQINDIASRLPN